VPSIQRIAALMGVSQMTCGRRSNLFATLGVIYSRQGKELSSSGIKMERDFRQVFPLPRK